MFIAASLDGFIARPDGSIDWLDRANERVPAGEDCGYGGVTIQRFLAAGLVDELTITTIPLLLGTGRPLFGRLPADVELEHLSTRAFDFGFVQSRYRISRTRT